jgi:hypothetical protein
MVAVVEGDAVVAEAVDAVDVVAGACSPDEGEEHAAAVAAASPAATPRTSERTRRTYPRRDPYAAGQSMGVHGRAPPASGRT